VVVHVDIRVHAGVQVLSDDIRCRLEAIVFGLDNLIPSATGLFLDPGSAGTVEADDGEGGCANIEPGGHFGHPGHVVAVQEYVSKAKLAQGIEEFILEVVGLQNHWSISTVVKCWA
jgi:hypothetical protein